MKEVVKIDLDAARRAGDAAHAKALRTKLEAACAKLQRRLLDKAKAEYAAGNAPALFAASFQFVIEALENSLVDLENPDVITLRFPDKQEGVYLAALLSMPTILCYPCFELSAGLTGKRLLEAVRPLVRKGALTIADTPSVRPLLRHDILFLRARTDETAPQDALFMTLQKIALVAAKRMKSINAREEALQWIKVLGMVQSRPERPDARLTEETAAQLVSDLRAAYIATGLALQYESL